MYRPWSWVFGKTPVQHAQCHNTPAARLLSIPGAPGQTAVLHPQSGRPAGLWPYSWTVAQCHGPPSAPAHALVLMPLGLKAPLPPYAGRRCCTAALAWRAKSRKPAYSSSPAGQHPAKPVPRAVAVITSRCTLARAVQAGQNQLTLYPSGLRGWTQVPLARAAWVQIPQLSIIDKGEVAGSM